MNAPGHTIPEWACPFLSWKLIGRGSFCSVDNLSGERKSMSFFEPEPHQGSRMVAKNYYAEKVVVMEEMIRSEDKIIYLVCYQV